MSAWSLLVDEASGAPYYFDAATEQSHWAATDHEGWMVKTDAASGHEYLLHAETGATRWCEPPESQQCVWEELKRFALRSFRTVCGRSNGRWHR